MSKLNKSEAIHALNDIVDMQKKEKDFIIFIPSKDNISEREIMQHEYELLGYYVNKHPLDSFSTKMNQLYQVWDLKEEEEGTTVSIGGIITECKFIQTKAGKKMAFLTLEDKTGRIEVVIFPKMFDKYNHYLEKNKLIEVHGKVEIDENEINEEIVRTAKVMASSVHPLEETKALKEIILRISCKEDLYKIKKVLQDNVGDVPVFLEYQNFILETSYKIKQTNDALLSIKELCLTREITL